VHSRLKLPSMITLVTITHQQGADALWQVLAEHIFCHVPCPTFDYRGKVTYIAICLRRIMTAIIDPSTIDDRSSPAVSLVMLPQHAYANMQL
jgi:hypothetical protein